MLKIEKNELRVGIFIIIPIVILLLFVMIKLGYSIFTSSIDVYLKIDSLTSVKEGTPVFIKGYPLGRVVDVKPVYRPALHFLATMRIRSDIELHEDCSAVIQNQNIIGDPSIEFQNPEKSGNKLLDGDVIEGIEYVNLEAIMQDVHILLTKLTGAVDIIKQISMESRHNLRTLVANLSNSVLKINNILEKSQKDVIEVLASFRETAKTMNEISKELKKHPLEFLLKGKKDTKKKK